MHQKISVFQVGEQEGHSVPGANGQRAGEDAAAVGLLHDGYLGKQEAGCWGGGAVWERLGRQLLLKELKPKIPGKPSTSQTNGDTSNNKTQIKLESLTENGMLFLGFSKLGDILQQPEASMFAPGGEVTAALVGGAARHLVGHRSAAITGPGCQPCQDWELKRNSHFFIKISWSQRRQVSSLLCHQ